MITTLTEQKVAVHVGFRTYPTASGKNISLQAEWLRESGRAPSEPSETPRWRITPRPESIPHIGWHIALQWLFDHFFVFCQSPILNEHSGVEGELCPYVGMG
jgi:hypothetical protein